MTRTFERHQLRKTRELTGRLWDFCPLSGERAGEHFPVLTPSCWETHPAFGLYRGEGAYTTHFAGRGDLLLECKGVSHTAHVFLDGREVGFHYNAYTAFCVELLGLPEGEHTLTIAADNRFSEESALHVPNDYMSYGGITRPVVLHELNSAYLTRLHVAPILREGKWHAHIRVTAKSLGDTRPVAVAVQILGKELCFPAEVLSGERTFEGELAFESVEVWSPEHPALTHARAVLTVEGEETDDLLERFGFREVKVEGDKILLNGKPLFLKGVCRHEDHPHFGCALPPEAMSRDLMLIKDLGCNAVRTAHYPNDERFLDLCDELGLLVWEENHARGLSEEQMANPNFRPQAEQVTREMVMEHFNHPCILIWGILNECASDTEYGKECYSRQFEIIRSLDRSRPCSFASCKFKTDICFGLPDIVSYNVYPKWYHDTDPKDYIEDLYDWVQTTEGKGKPFLITEIGAGGIYGYRTPYKTKWSEEYQAEALESQLSAVLSSPFASGVFIWQFADIRISEEWWHGRPRTMNNKGIFDEYRRAKLCLEVVKRLFHEH